MCNACFLRTWWYTIVFRISSLITNGGQAFWHEIFLLIYFLTHFFPPESHLVKLLIGPMNQSLLIWVWAESDVFPSTKFNKILLCPSAPLGRKFSCLRQTGLSPQATWTLSNSWEWDTPFDWVHLDSSIMPLLKICQDLKWEKKKIYLLKNFHCWFNSTMVILWIVMSVFNYYSPILLFLSFFFFCARKIV